MIKKILFGIINSIVDRYFKIVDYRIDFKDVELLDKGNTVTLVFDKIHGLDRQWNIFFSRPLPLDPLFIKAIPIGEIVGNGIVINQQGEIVLESTLFQKEYLNKMNQKHLILFRRFLSGRIIDGVMIPLSSILENNYYHWVAESLTRLMLVEEVLTQSNSFIVLDESSLKFKTESLDFLLNIPESRILKKKTKTVFRGEILLPSFTHTRNAKTNQVDICHPHLIKRINERIRHKMAAQVNSTLPKNFILSRKGTSERQILNEEFLLKALPGDFSIVDTAELSFENQVHLFFNAELVISTHGAGLTNIIFGRSITIIELFPQDRKITDQLVFTQISATLGFDHYLITYASCNDRQDVEIDLSLINKILPVVSKTSTVIHPRA